MAEGDSLLPALQRLVARAPSLRFRPAWLTAHGPRIEAAPSSEAAADELLGLLAASDLRECCEGSLPPGLDRCHDVRIEGAHLVQLLQVVDIAHPRASGATEEVQGEGNVGEEARDGPMAPTMPEAAQRGPKMLKVCLTDGAQAVCGIERKPIAALRKATPGSKVILGGRPLLRRGLLLLEPENLELLCQAEAVAEVRGPAGQGASPSLSAPSNSLPWRSAQSESTLRARCFVCEARRAEEGLLLRLCDGVQELQALMPDAILASLFGHCKEDWPAKVRMLHGIFQIRSNSGPQHFPMVLSFARGPQAAALEAQLSSLERQEGR
mmetsp:Transcript_22023/g.48672  ORF Transcript_22023/g.48672 Transcript_22023/m.48672 type:complete len:324 (+) Transcript_22023:83-1054(+)